MTLLLKLNKLSSISILLISVCMVYKIILKHFGFDFLIYIATTLFILFYLHLFIIKPIVNKNFIWPLFFIWWGVLTLIISVFSGSALVGFSGFSGTYLYMLFWLFSFSSVSRLEMRKLFDNYIYIQIFLATGTAFFAIYQYFVDPTIFGLNETKYYSDIDYMLSGGMTRRATSFIGSPQNLGIYSALMFGVLFMIDFKKHTKWFLEALFVVCGMLSGSAAFLGGLLLFLFGYYFKSKQKFGSFFLLLLFVLIAVFMMGEIAVQNMGVDTVVFDTIVSNAMNLSIGIEERGFSRLVNHEGLFQYLFGQGLGTTDRLAEILTDSITMGNESYLLKLFYEMGAGGIITFLLIFFMSMFYSYTTLETSGRVIFALSLPILANLLITPSFTGFTMSFIIWPFILFPIFFFRPGCRLLYPGFDT